MNLTVVGDPSLFEEFNNKFSDLISLVNDKENKSVDKNANNYINNIFYVEDYDLLDENHLEGNNIIFDFYLEESIENFDVYKDYKDIIVFGNITKSSISEIFFFHVKYDALLFGFNGMPGMLNRNYLEVTCFNEKDHNILKDVCQKLKTDYLVVDDRVGMITPRIIAMIINEAFFTVQEGTASKDDIDIAMKLGTNYPYGPFEWAEKIGIKHIYELLEAIYEDTKDERYKISPLLKKTYMRLNS